MTEQRVLIKDGSDLVDFVLSASKLRHQMGIPESTEEFDAREAGKKWHEMRKARAAQEIAS